MKNKEIFIVSIVLGFVTIFVIGDVVIDYLHGSPLIHSAIEFLVIFASCFSIFILTGQMNRKNVNLELNLEKSKEDQKYWHDKSKIFLEGLSKNIDEQLNNWSFTKSEKEIAILLIKGLSVCEISEIRNTKEKTIQAQATAIYKKSNTAGRHELAAFFLEDLLTPIV